MVDVKPLSEAKENYRQSASRAGEAYKLGVNRADWKTAAESPEAEQLFATKMQDAISNQSRRKGIQKVTNSQWQNRASTKGGAQISGAMRESVEDWSTGFAPYAEALEGINLPPRSSDPMANIDNRLKLVVQTLVDKKKQITG